MDTEANVGEKLDVVEVSDAILRQDRYGQRNYRQSIGADNKRHWRGEFVAEEETVDIGVIEVDEDVIAEEQRIVDEQAAADTAALNEDAGDEATPPTEDEVKNFFDPMQNADDVANGFTDGPTEDDSVDGNAYGTFEDEAETTVQEASDFFEDPLKNVEGLEDVVTAVDEDTETEEEVEEAELADDPEKREAIENSIVDEEDFDQTEDQTDADERTDTLS